MSKKGMNRPGDPFGASGKHGRDIPDNNVPPVPEVRTKQKDNK